jgi:3'(2'), 5'-bisphosphate nucleotidase
MHFTHHMPEAVFALENVRAAARLGRELQRGLRLPAMTKLDASPVTVADYACQALVAHRLIQAFPDDALVAEEDMSLLAGPAAGQAVPAILSALAPFEPDVTERALNSWIGKGGAVPGSRFWTLDPVDGTKGFVRGDQYVVALALVEDGRVQVGALGCPNLTANLQPHVGGPGCVALAVRGEGAWIAPLERGEMTPVYVSKRDDHALARVLRSFEDAHTDPAQLDRIFRLLGIQQEPRRMDSQAKAVVLAGGAAELVFRLLPAGRTAYREKIWDAAAGSLLVEEAGGRVTDLRGRELDFGAGRELTNNIGVVSSNGRLHAAALAAVRAVLPEASR